MISEGKYKAKVMDATLEETRNGNLMVRVMFQTESEETCDWVGSLSTDKSQDFVLEQLARLGWKGKSVEELANLTGMDLDCEKSLEVVIEHTTTDRGSTFANVKYINEAKLVMEQNYKLDKLKALGLDRKLNSGKTADINKVSGQKVTTTKVSSDKNVVKCETIEEATALLDELPF